MPNKKNKLTDKAKKFAIGKAKEALSAIGGKATEWVTDQILDVFGLAEEEDRTTEQIEVLQASVDSVLKNQEVLSKKLDNEFNELRVELKGIYSKAVGFDPVEKIRFLFDRMRIVAGSNDARTNRIDEVEDLRKSILDNNQGIASALFRLHDVLMGHDKIIPGGHGALAIAMNGIIKRHSALCEKPDYTFKTFNEQAEEYLQELLDIQVMGATLIINAQTAKSGMDSELEEEYKELVEKMNQQKAYFQSLIPNWVLDKDVWHAGDSNWVSGKYLRSACMLQNYSPSAEEPRHVESSICYHTKDDGAVMAGWCSQMPGCEEIWDIIPIDFFRDQNKLRESFNCGPKIDHWAKDIFSLAVVDSNTLNRRHLTIGKSGSLVLEAETTSGFLPRVAYFRFLLDEQSLEEALFWNNPLIDPQDKKTVREYLADPKTFAHGNRFKHEQIRLRYTAAPVGYVICLNIDESDGSDPSKKYIQIGDDLGHGNTMRNITLESRENASQIRLGFPVSMSEHRYNSDSWMNSFRQMNIHKKDEITASLKEWTYKRLEEARDFRANYRAPEFDFLEDGVSPWDGKHYVRKWIKKIGDFNRHGYYHPPVIPIWYED